MREEPTWRLPVGILGLMITLLIYAIIVARYMPELIGGWPVWIQTVIYLTLGLIWLLPLKRFLVWMETGQWNHPDL